MDGNDNVPEDSGDPDGARPRMPSKQLDQEGVLLEKLCRLKNVRSGYLSAVTTRRNEIDALLSSEENVHLVKEKLPAFWLPLKRLKKLISPICRIFRMIQA